MYDGVKFTAPEYIDNWVDIAGYATLVADRLEEDNDA